MCDTLVVVRRGRVLFAKNSDRDANEAQVLDWQPRRRHPPGATVRCTWIEIPQAEETFAVLLSRPFWMWGAEMGANEHRVVVGNEAVFTREPKAESGLTGMDLVRLALERAATARQAAEVITALLEEHGQGGGCGHEDRSFTYHSSFLLADPEGALVLETAGQRWAVEEVEGARSISNLLTIPEFVRAHGDFLYTRVAAGEARRRRTAELAAGARGVPDLLGVLRDHGAGRRGAPRYRWLNGTLGAPCMHGGGAVASSVTTASWVSELSRGGARHWVTATAAPCLGLFKPVRLGDPLDLGPSPGDCADSEQGSLLGRSSEAPHPGESPSNSPFFKGGGPEPPPAHQEESAGSLWWRHERLHRRVLADPERLGALFLPERDEVEARWLAEPPEPAAAFAEADRLLAEWTAAVAGARVDDVRPFWARRYWRLRNRRAGLGAEAA